MRRKVVLYNPRAVFYTMPLALVAIGSHLDSERYEVVIIDGRLEDDPEAAVLAQLDDAICLGISVLTGDPIRDALGLSRLAKAHHPDLPIVWGGWHPSLFGRECLEEPSVDISVQGQGEATFAEIVERLAACEELSGCLGCAHRTASGEVCLEAPRPFETVDNFRRHDFGLIDVERYFALKGKRQLDYISSQGCPFRCAFCADPFVFQRKWAGLDPVRMGEEIEALWRRYRFDDLSFQDETYFTYPKRVEAVADELIRRELPITWAATLRADQCARLPEEVFAKCKASGLRRVLVGVEAGSQEMMDRIRKDIKLEQVFFTAERCRKHGVAVIFPFIVGFPGETEVSVQASLDVAKQLRAMSPEFQTPIFFFKPYPGSPITDDAVAEGYSLPCSLDEWADFDFIGSAGPWVSPDLYRKVERFKFYQHVGWSRPKLWRRPIQSLARWRCRRDFYGLPVEKAVSDWLWPQPALS
ncbi:MAG: radical SAM protein [Acidobacteriota bacterium]